MINTGYMIRCRQERRISQHKLARKIGAAQACISSWESGRNEPLTMKRFVNWCLAVGADPREAIKWQ
jgi:DNA-binding transcriptional regulator YiaG